MFQTWSSIRSVPTTSQLRAHSTPQTQKMIYFEEMWTVSTGRMVWTRRPAHAGKVPMRTNEARFNKRSKQSRRYPSSTHRYYTAGVLRPWRSDFCRTHLTNLESHLEAVRPTSIRILQQRPNSFCGAEIPLAGITITFGKAKLKLWHVRLVPMPVLVDLSRAAASKVAASLFGWKSPRSSFDNAIHRNVCHG